MASKEIQSSSASSSSSSSSSSTLSSSSSDQVATNGQLIADSLERYCKLDNLAVEDSKFCYDINTIQQEITRLLKFGASDERICKKLKAINPDFCITKTVLQEKSFSRKKGIIYI